MSRFKDKWQNTEIFGFRNRKLVIYVGMNMRIEHIAMYVNDLESARDFFVTYFGGQSDNGYHNKDTDFRSYFVSFKDGTRIEIMNKPDMADMGKLLNRTGYAHMCVHVTDDTL